MKNVFSLTICFLLFLQIACGQTQPDVNKSTPQNKADELKKDYPNLKIKVDEINNATVKEDFNKVIDLTYPKYVEKFGGREKISSVIKTGVQARKAEGFEMLSITSGNARQIVKIDNEIFAVVPISVVFKTPSGKARGEDFIVGVSPDNGADWKFISGIDQKQLRVLFPQIAENIQIPVASDLVPTENK